MKLKATKFQIILEIIGLLIVIGMIVYVYIKWNQLPQQIPRHYNIIGEVDSWGSKGGIIAIPIMSVVLYTFLTVLSFLPQTWSLPVKITDKNGEAVYRCARSLLIFIKIEFLGVFLYITYFMTAALPIPPSFIPVMLFIIFGTITYFVKRIFRIGRKGSVSNN